MYIHNIDKHFGELSNTLQHLSFGNLSTNISTFVQFTLSKFYAINKKILNLKIAADNLFACISNETTEYFGTALPTFKFKVS